MGWGICMGICENNVYQICISCMCRSPLQCWPSLQQLTGMYILLCTSENSAASKAFVCGILCNCYLTIHLVTIWHTWPYFVQFLHRILSVTSHGICIVSALCCVLTTCMCAAGQGGTCFRSWSSPGRRNSQVLMRYTSLIEMLKKFREDSR